MKEQDIVNAIVEIDNAIDILEQTKKNIIEAINKENK